MWAGYRNQIPRWRMWGLSMSTPEFLPTDIAGLQLWLDFSDRPTLFIDAAKTILVTADGDVIGAAEDKSGNGNDALQATTANKPTYRTGIQNGRSIGRFDGIDDFLTVSDDNSLDLATMTIFAIFNQTGAAPIVNAHIVAKDDAYLFKSEQTATTFPRFQPFISGAFRTAEASASLSGWTLLEGRYDGSTGNLFVNGVGDGSFSLIGTINASIDDLLVGRFPGVANTFFPGDIGELMIYNSAISVEAQVSLLAYSRTKWATP